MDVKVRDKTFTISFVNNWSVRQYGVLTDLLYELTDTVDEFEHKINSAPSSKDVRMLLREGREKQRNLKNKIADLRDSIVKEILETNNYEYDVKWWMHKATLDDMNDFMLNCIRGEVPNVKPSKKK